MRTGFKYVCALLVWLAPAFVQAQTLIPYDDFRAGVIDPAKWTAPAMCGGLVYDCAREVQGRELRLAVRGYGDQTTDVGSSSGASALQIANPDVVNAMQLNFSVDRLAGQACSTNSDAAHAQFAMGGNFFNNGSADPTGDLSAYLIAEHRSDDPTTPAGHVRLSAFLSQNGNTISQVDLGTIWQGEPATATLSWDQTNHVFNVTVVKSFSRPRVVTQKLTYSMNDAYRAVNSFKSVQASSFAPNCSAARSFSAMEVRVDNVKVNVPTTPLPPAPTGPPVFAQT